MKAVTRHRTTRGPRDESRRATGGETTQRFVLSEEAYVALTAYLRRRTATMAALYLLGSIALGAAAGLIVFGSSADRFRYVLPGAGYFALWSLPFVAYALWRGRRRGSERDAERLSGPFNWSVTRVDDWSLSGPTFEIGHERIEGPWKLLWMRYGPTRGFVDRTVGHHHVLAIVDDPGLICFAVPGYDPFAVGPAPIYDDTMASV